MAGDYGAESRAADAQEWEGKPGKIEMLER
jgi:hypothetical protein